jgi:hypothetical protein
VGICVGDVVGVSVFVGVAEGSAVGTIVVGSNVGVVLGSPVGCIVGSFVGCDVIRQCLVSVASAMNPSKHWHRHWVADTETATVDVKSQPCIPLSHGCSVGMCVGMVVGATLVGTAVGTSDGTFVGTALTGEAEGKAVGALVASFVGISVGAVVSTQLLSSVGSVTKPSRHWHAHSKPSWTASVLVKSHPCVPSSQTSSVGM